MKEYFEVQFQNIRRALKPWSLFMTKTHLKHGNDLDEIHNSTNKLFIKIKKAIYIVTNGSREFTMYQKFTV